MQLVITEGQLSDLFFNYDHSELRQLYAASHGRNSTGPTDEQFQEALTADAKDFVVCYGEHADVSADELTAHLIADYIKRR